MDAVTAVSGSGPAYFYLLMEIMEDSAVQLGLPRDVARTLVRQTALGAARAAGMPDADLVALRASVTSPGGTTAAALAVHGPGRHPRYRDARAHCRARPRRRARPRIALTLSDEDDTPCRTPSHSSSPRCSTCTSSRSSCGSSLAWARADFRNPLAQFILKVTNPLVIPARRFIPSVARHRYRHARRAARAAVAGDRNPGEDRAAWATRRSARSWCSASSGSCTWC